MKKADWKMPAIYIVATELVGALSALLSGPISQVYKELAQPPLSPPGWVFGLVWPILYALLGLGAYLVRRETGPGSPELRLYWLQLAVNALWPIVFFRFRLYWLALVVLLVLVVLVLWTVVRFSRESWWAALLLVPYLLWILYATYLNAGFALLN